VWLNYGNVLSDLERREEAEQAYRKALELGDTDAHNNLAQELTELGRFEEAREEYLKGIEAGDELAKQNYQLFLEEMREDAPDLHRRWTAAGDERDGMRRGEA